MNDIYLKVLAAIIIDKDAKAFFKEGIMRGFKTPHGWLLLTMTVRAFFIMAWFKQRLIIIIFLTNGGRAKSIIFWTLCIMFLLKIFTYLHVFVYLCACGKLSAHTLQPRLFIYNPERERTRGQWAVYYTGTQSFIMQVFLFVSLIILGTLVNSTWLVHWVSIPWNLCI